MADVVGNATIVEGTEAHGAAASGYPVRLGATARTSLPGAVDNADAVDLIADKHGQLVILAALREELVQNNITLSSTTETTLVAAGAAGVFRDLTFLAASNTSSTGVRVDFRDATAGTVRLSMFLAADGGGFVMDFSRGCKQTTAANNWTAQLSGAVTDVRIFAQAVEVT